MDMMEDKRIVKIGSRKSQLALVQTHTVIEMLEEIHPNIEFKVITMSTKGDQILDQPLSKIGEKSLFTKELEIALEDLKVDMVVHSLKDLPSTLPPGMCIGAVLKRDSPYDCVVFSKKHNALISEGLTLAKLPEGSVVGTSSLRRISQLKRAYPHLKFADVRGNINTRLRKLDDSGMYDALVLAEAGLDRMGWHERVNEVLKEDVCMYSISQGAMAVECRSFDLESLDLLAPITDRESLVRCLAERAMLRSLEGGCSVPIACHTEVSEDGKEMKMKAGVFSLDGSEACIVEKSAPLEEQIAVPTPTPQSFENGGEPPAKQRKRNPSCPYSEVVQGHSVAPVNVTSRYLSVKRKDCPYFSGIICRRFKHVLLERAEKVGLDLAQKLRENGATEILVKAKSENDKLKTIMDEERRLRIENENMLKDVCHKVVRTISNPSSGEAAPSAMDVVKSAIEDHKQKLKNGDATKKVESNGTASVPQGEDSKAAKCPYVHKKSLEEKS